MNQREEKLMEFVMNAMTYAAHDFDHVMRVYKTCLTLAENEKNIDYEVLVPAVLLHDIARSKEDEDCSGEIDHAVLGAKMAETILEELGYEPALVGKIKHCIMAHRFRSGFAPETLEAKLLFDADKLDVIGAVGIARSFMLAGKHGERIYSDVPIEAYLKENTGANGRVKDLSQHSSNLEFELKLKQIPDKLHTEKAKAIAKARIRYMTDYFKTLKNEIDGLS